MLGRLESNADYFSWLEANDYSHLSPIEIYLRGYVWAMYSIITIGYGYIQVASTAERIFAIVVMISGAMLCDAGVAAVLSSMIDSHDRQSGFVKQKFDVAEKFCSNFSTVLSPELQGTMLSYFNYLSHSLNDHNEQEDMEMLPDILRLDLVRKTCYRPLCSITFLVVESPEIKLGFVHSLMRRMTTYIAFPGQIIGGYDRISECGVKNDLFVLRRGRMYAFVPSDNHGNAKHGIMSAAPMADRDYLHNGDIIWKLNQNSQISSQSKMDVNMESCEDLESAEADTLGKSVMITVGAISEFRGCTTSQRRSLGSGDVGLGISSGFSNSLSLLNSFLSGGTTAYLRVTCGAQKAKTAVQHKKKTRGLIPAPGVDLNSDFDFDETFQFEVPADTHLIKISMYLQSHYTEVSSILGVNVSNVKCSIVIIYCFL